MSSIDLANKMISVYLHTPVEKYPEARALDVLDTIPFNDHSRTVAFKLFSEWLEYSEEV